MKQKQAETKADDEILKNSEAKEVAVAASNIDVEKLLEHLEHKSGFQTDKILAEELQLQPQTIQKATPQSNDTVLLQISVSAEAFEKLRKLQDYLSHIDPTKDLGKLLTRLVDQEVKRIEGKEIVAKTVDGKEVSTITDERSCLQESEFSDAGSTQSFSAKEIFNGVRARRHLRITVRRRLMRRAGNCCEHVESHSGVRCTSRFQLQVDHIFPLAKGGKDEEENMRVLCAIHNRAEALRFGLCKGQSERRKIFAS
ncbi:MAG: HNH endonuclease [Sphingobacteriales bacterium]|nr:MAG: HNH endonuclease [Sphingobacteriales bacterium]